MSLVGHKDCQVRPKSAVDLNQPVLEPRVLSVQLIHQLTQCGGGQLHLDRCPKFRRQVSGQMDRDHASTAVTDKMRGSSSPTTLQLSPSSAEAYSEPDVVPK